MSADAIKGSCLAGSVTYPITSSGVLTFSAVSFLLPAAGTALAPMQKADVFIKFLLSM
jgi:hypothetical protein